MFCCEKYLNFVRLSINSEVSIEIITREKENKLWNIYQLNFSEGGLNSWNPVCGSQCASASVI